jgi:uncharacterized protein (TIGR03435 family)
MIELAVCFALLGVSNSTAQVTEGPRFDVVSVKVSSPLGDSRFFIEPGRVHCNCLLNQMIQEAYGIQQSRIIGPKWVLDPLAVKGTPLVYELDARFPAEVEKGQVWAMMRQMLADRFHLVVHRDLRDEPVYALRVGEGGLKLKRPALVAPADPSVPPVWQSLIGFEPMTESIHVHGTMTLARLASSLSGAMDRNVVDETAQEGEFEIYFDARIPGMRAAPGLRAPGRGRTPFGTAFDFHSNSRGWT